MRDIHDIGDSAAHLCIDMQKLKPAIGVLSREILPGRTGRRRREAYRGNSQFHRVGPCHARTTPRMKRQMFRQPRYPGYEGRGVGRDADTLRRTSRTVTTAFRKLSISGSPRAGIAEIFLMRDASRVGVASAKSSRTGRTYWAMEVPTVGGSLELRQPLRPPVGSGVRTRVSLARLHKTTLRAGPRSDFRPLNASKSPKDRTETRARLAKAHYWRAFSLI